MLAETGSPTSVDDFIEEATARHRSFAQNYGIEYPPKMLAELTRLGLIK